MKAQKEHTKWKQSPAKGKKSNFVPKVRDRAKAEARLLDAGLEVFSKLGVDGATTKLISQKSGVNESLIIRYFGSKEGLLLAIIDNFSRDWNEDPLPYPGQNTLLDELMCFVRSKVDYIIKNKDLIRILVSKALVDQRFAQKIRQKAPHNGDPRLIERLISLKKARLVSKQIDPGAIASHVGCQLFGVSFMSHMIFGAKPKEIQESMERFVTIFVHGLETT